MKILNIAAVVCLCYVSLTISSCTASRKATLAGTDQVFQRAKEQYRGMLQQATDTTKLPRTSWPDGRLKTVEISDWTSGFWPGCLWYVYEQDGGVEWRETARKWTHALEASQFNTAHHDIGFMMYNSYGNGWRLLKDSSYLPVLVQSARSLVTRYSPQVKSIRSWNPRKSIGGKNIWQYPVIIDNMMNLELLFFVANITGDKHFREVAIAHAETAMKNHIRPDGSTYHVVDYDSLSGQVRHRQTAQGFSDSSTWARGQAWGIYGFTMMFRFTKDDRFLKTAERLADFYLAHPHLPDDLIPLWDLNVSDYTTDGIKYRPDWNYDPSRFNSIPRDASAAAIIASALLELSGYTGKENGKKYVAAAEKMISALSSETYLAAKGTNNHFLLKHSTGNLPGNNEIDVPLIYADYYFLEALLRYRNKNALSNSFN